MSDDFGCEILFKWTYSCRLCLSAESGIDLFSKDTASQDILTKLRSCLNLLVYNGDPMPRKLCTSCSAKLIDWWEFREKCVKVEQNLKQRLEPYKKIDFVQDYFDRSAKFTSSEVVSSSCKLLNLKYQSSNCEEVNSSTSFKCDNDESALLTQADKAALNLHEHKKASTSDYSSTEKQALAPSNESSENTEEEKLWEQGKRPLDNPSFPQSIKKVKDWAGNEDNSTVGTIVSVTGGASALWGSQSPTHSKTSIMTDFSVGSSENFGKTIVKQERYIETCPTCKLDFYTEESYNSHNCYMIDISARFESDECYGDEENVESLSPDLPSETADQKILRRSSRNVPKIENYSENIISEELKQSLDLRRKPCPLVHKIKRTQRNSKKITEKKKLTPWKCIPCFQYFTSTEALVTHYTSLKCRGRQVNVVDCEFCQRQFLTLSELIQHQVVHLKINIHQNEEDLIHCKECNLRFSDEKRLEWHSIVHDPKDLPEDATKFTCLECSEIYIQKDLYDEHILSHNKRASDHVCSYCNTHFLLPNQLLSHIESTHCSKTVTFKCPSCSQTFLEKSELEEHQKSHSSSTRCFRCGQLFPNSKELEQHEFAKHKNPTPYSCRKCLLRFSARSQLLMHIQSHKTDSPSSESESNVCHICDSKFLLPADLQLHLKTHKLKVEIPTESSKSDDGVTSNSPKESNFAKFKCSLCSKLFVRAFSVIRHGQQLHKGQEVVPHRLKRPVLLTRRSKVKSSKVRFRCSKCPKYFFSKTNLNLHVSKIHPNKKPVVKIETKDSPQADKCPFCQKEIKMLTLHIKKCHRGESLDPTQVSQNIEANSDLVCQYCFRVCSTPHNRKVHESIHYAGKVQWSHCKCGKKFFNKILFENHTKICSLKKPKCEKCDRTFSKRKYLEKHVCQIVQHEHKCGQCPSTFPSLTSLQWHILKTHIRNQTVGQPSTSQSSSQPEIPKMEMTRQNERELWREESNKIVCKVGDKYYCTYCDCEFSTTEECQKHQPIHPRGNWYAVQIDDSLYQCTICDKIFESRKGSLLHINHHKKINNESDESTKTLPTGSVAEPSAKKKSITKRTFRCPLCISTFSSEENIRQHIFTAHSEESGTSNVDY